LENNIQTKAKSLGLDHLIKKRPLPFSSHENQITKKPKLSINNSLNGKVTIPTFLKYTKEDEKEKEVEKKKENEKMKKKQKQQANQKMLTRSLMEDLTEETTHIVPERLFDFSGFLISESLWSWATRMMNLQLCPLNPSSNVAPNPIVFLLAEKSQQNQESILKSKSADYSSVIANFRSQQFKKLDSKENKEVLPLKYSNKIDPMKIMCRFELHGTCNDPECPFQHIKQMAFDCSLFFFYFFLSFF